MLLPPSIAHSNRKKHATERGVSPVIAALLLVVIVVTAFTGVYLWVFQQLETYRFLLRRDIFESRMMLAEAGIVEFAWIDDGKLYIYLRNVGEVDLCVLDVFFNGSLIASNAGFCLAPGEGDLLILPLGTDARYGRVRIVTGRFNEIEVEVTRVGE